jgi:hypothetical protein
MPAYLTFVSVTDSGVARPFGVRKKVITMSALHTKYELKNHSHLVNLLSFYSTIKNLLRAEISLISYIYFLPILPSPARR